jgi:hypothetical protein
LTGLLFRLISWQVFPAFSDDIFRYRWEGKLQNAGGNPYQVRPDDPAWQSLRDPTYPNVVLRDFRAGYGPLLELTEMVTYKSISPFVSEPFAQVFWFKLPAALADLGILAFLCIWLAALKLPLERIQLYAWNPLPIFEFWVNGHNDAIVVMCVIAALWLAAKQRWPAAYGVLSFGIAAKLWPVLLLPLFIASAPRRSAWALIAVPIFGALAWPYRSDVTSNVQFLTGFLGGWRNNDSLYGAVRYLAWSDASAKYFVIALIGCLALAAAAGIRRRSLTLPRASLAVITGTLLFSANCHPWYLTWIAPLVAVEPAAVWLLWMALVPIAYQVLIPWIALGEWNHVSPWRWAVHGPVLVWLGFGWIARCYLRRFRSS